MYGRSERTTSNEALKPIIENEHRVPVKLEGIVWLLQTGENGAWVEKNILGKVDISNDIETEEKKI